MEDATLFFTDKSDNILSISTSLYNLDLRRLRSLITILPSTIKLSLILLANDLASDTPVDNIKLFTSTISLDDKGSNL